MSNEVLKVAVEGCCHGELDMIYAHITTQPYSSWPELLIICGDFQSIRNEKDLDSMAVPDKFKRLGDFKDYYDGKKKAPVLTVFVGGNHEASNYLQELPYGGWVAPNIYYMGYSNVIWYKGLRIGGLSGIYKYFNFYKPHYERVPYDEKSKRSVYHVRFQEFLKLSLIRDLNLNCFVSHDWPEGITQYGNLQWLLNKKPFFKKDIQNNELGSLPAKLLLQNLMPHYWFSAHLHVRFEAYMRHGIPKRRLSKHEETIEKRPKVNSDEIDLDGLEEEGDQKICTESNEDEIELNLEEDEENKDNKEEQIQEPNSFAKGFSQTNFLALDKCLPKRHFLETIEIPVTNTHVSQHFEGLHYDREYLQITKWFQKFSQTEIFKELRVKDVGDDLVEQLWQDIAEVKIDMDLQIPQNFEASLENPKKQTQEFIKKLNGDVQL